MFLSRAAQRAASSVTVSDLSVVSSGPSSSSSSDTLRTRDVLPAEVFCFLRDDRFRPMPAILAASPSRSTTSPHHGLSLRPGAESAPPLTPQGPFQSVRGLAWFANCLLDIWLGLGAVVSVQFAARYLPENKPSISQRRAKCTATCRSRLRTRRSSTRSSPHSTQSESPKAGVGMNQIVGCIWH